MSILQRIAQPSGIRGIITVLGLIGWQMNPSLAEPIATAVGAAIAIYEIFRDDKKQQAEVISAVTEQVKALPQKFNTTSDGRDATAIDGGA